MADGQFQTFKIMKKARRRKPSLEIERFVVRGTYRFGYDALVAQIPPHPPDKLNLLLNCEAGDGCLENVAQLDLVCGDEGVVVQESEETHDELAIHTICHAAVPGDGVAKVLDLEGALETRGKEAAEGSDERREGRENEGVKMHRGKRRRPMGVDRDEGYLGDLEGMREKNAVDVAFETGEDVGAEVLQICPSAKR